MARLTVLGGAESGVGAAVLAKVKGFEVFLSDNGKIKEEYAAMLRKWDIPYEEGGHTESKVLAADEIVKSPGIPDSAPLVRKLVAQGTPVISEIEFAGRYDNAKKICITGSNGKNTTTSLIYYLLQNAGLNVGLGGNIGKSYALQVATEKHDYYVLEISSFQLDGCYSFRPDIAIITNITPDHLDRYDYKLENYVKSKFRITQNLRPEDCFIFDSDDAITIAHLDKIVLKAKSLPFSQEREVAQGAFLRNDEIVVRYGEDESSIYLKELALGGRHNVYNSMAAALAAKAAGIGNAVIRESLRTFKAIEHRLEPVLSVGGVLYINDSKATNVDACWYALESMKTKVILIIGGKDKGNDYEPIKPLVKEKCSGLVYLGADNQKLHDNFDQMGIPVRDTHSMKECMEACYEMAQPGETVLLSPCCASFDLFKNMEDRGEQFKELARNL